MSASNTEFVPDPATRPTQVRWAFGLWLAAGVLLVALAVVTVATGVFQSEFNFGLAAVELLVAGVGLAYVLLARKATCEPQWRGALASLTLVALVMVLILTIGFQSPGLSSVLVATVIGFVGTVLAYRPKADAWFNGRELPDADADDAVVEHE